MSNAEEPDHIQRARREIYTLQGKARECLAQLRTGTDELGRYLEEVSHAETADRREGFLGLLYSTTNSMSRKGHELTLAAKEIQVYQTYLEVWEHMEQVDQLNHVGQRKNAADTYTDDGRA